jgi:Holliday junction resolvase RusA-like endonuclease
MTKQDKWAKRPRVMRYKKFGQLVRLARVAIPQPCRVVFWMPMPKSWGARIRTVTHEERHQSKPDLDNLLKGLLDAVYYQQGDADKRIWSVWAEKRWTDGPGHFTIEELEGR